MGRRSDNKAMLTDSNRERVGMLVCRRERRHRRRLLLPRRFDCRALLAWCSFQDGRQAWMSRLRLVG